LITSAETALLFPEGTAPLQVLLSTYLLEMKKLLAQKKREAYPLSRFIMSAGLKCDGALAST
jgi:hypothetical protein